MSEGVGRSPQATIIGSSDASADVCAKAEAIGRMLARLGITVITGGRGGVMEAASRGARETAGLTVGILPSTNLSEANSWCRVVIPTGLGDARNVFTALSGDFLIVIGGAAGTLSEICFAWMHGRPILTLKGSEGWADKLGGEALDHRQSSTLVECSDLDDLERAVIETCQRLHLTVQRL